MMSLVAFCLLVLSTLIAHVFSCACPQLSARDTFCSADFATLVYVKDNGVLRGEDRVYTVQTLRTYRAKNQNGVNRRHIHVLESDYRSCGTNLQAGKYYMLSGHYQIRQPFLNRMTITPCDLQLKFVRNPFLVFSPPRCNTDGSASDELRYKSWNYLDL